MHPYSTVGLARCFSHHLTSFDGEKGLSSLLDRVLLHWDEVMRLWNAGDIDVFASALVRCAKECDQTDLRANDFKLRSEMPYLDRTFDPLVCSKICLSILERLTGDEPIYDVVSEIVHRRPYRLGITIS